MANTPLLELRNIGKIYVSESNVAVGIRGVNLSFERGEFVAVTGKSGSGKSTLLNVISGMDTYEEGELYLDGEPTSHYLQKDWEEYRQQYISFIFQDYNILESFTVLQNVELALMHIEDPAERRSRAMDLLRRVGLESHIHHKGSKLSGGQKQRTVIARALAKDSPIILADEPTGNLDSQSSKEIIELLREVSRDKLVIVVTHNFEQVEDHATRHIRIFDGAVELDHRLEPTAVPSQSAKPAVPPPTDLQRTAHTLRNGLILGRARFAATPKLSVFLCILMTVTALVITMMTSISSDASGLFDRQEMFTHINGRAVIVRRDGAIITDEELSALAADVGAKDYMHYDSMLDNSIWLTMGDNYNRYEFTFGYPATDVRLDAGRYPEAPDEVILEIPISLKEDFGGNSFTETELPLLFDMATYRVVGVRYYYDNTRTPRMLFSEEGYKVASAIAFYRRQSGNFTCQVDIGTGDEDKVGFNTFLSNTFVDFGLEPGTFYVNDSSVIKGLINGEFTRDELTVKPTLTGAFVNYQYYEHLAGGGDFMVEIAPGYGSEDKVEYRFENTRAVWDISDGLKRGIEEHFQVKWNQGYSQVGFIALSPDILRDFLYEHYYEKAYTQASLFFENDREAHRMVDALRERGYTAVVSDETVEEDVFTAILTKLGYAMDAIGWVISIVFATIFLSLCSSRAMNATRGDIAIMRSMGIPARIVRISIYIQTLIALIPAFVITAITCTVVYLVPKTNYMFPFLHWPDYLIIAAVLILIALNLSRKYVKRMFHESVKKTMKGGNKS